MAGSGVRVPREGRAAAPALPPPPPGVAAICSGCIKGVQEPQRNQVRAVAAAPGRGCARLPGPCHPPVAPAGHPVTPSGAGVAFWGVLGLHPGRGSSLLTFREHLAPPRRSHIPVPGGTGAPPSPLRAPPVPSLGPPEPCPCHPHQARGRSVVQTPPAPKSGQPEHCVPSSGGGFPGLPRALPGAQASPRPRGSPGACASPRCRRLPAFHAFFRRRRLVGHSSAAGFAPAELLCCQTQAGGRRGGWAGRRDGQVGSPGLARPPRGVPCVPSAVPGAAGRGGMLPAPVLFPASPIPFGPHPFPSDLGGSLRPSRCWGGWAGAPRGSEPRRGGEEEEERPRVKVNAAAPKANSGRFYGPRLPRAPAGLPPNPARPSRGAAAPWHRAEGGRTCQCPAAAERMGGTRAGGHRGVWVVPGVG